MATVSNLATNPALHDTLPYDALKDFDPVSLLGRAPIVPYVHPKFQPKSIKELIAFGKTNPVPFGSAGTPKPSDPKRNAEMRRSAPPASPA